MAVNLNTIAMYQREVEAKTELWDEEDSVSYPKHFINDRIIKTKGLIRNLKIKEQNLLNSIAKGLSITELRQRIKEYHTAGFSLLSHADAERIVLRYQLAVAKYNLQTVDQFVDWFWNRSDIPEQYNDALQKNLNKGKVVEKIILDIVNNAKFFTDEKGNTIGGRVQSHKRIADVINESGLDPYKLLNVLGDVTVKRLKSEIGIDGLQKPKITDKNMLFDVPLDDGTHQYIDWYGITSGQKAEQIKKAIGKGKFDTKALEDTFANAITSYLAQEKGLPLAISEIEKIVRYIIRTDPLAPFFGNNVKGITGLLGEIQALCYFRLLLGPKFDLENKKVQYTARQISKGDLGDKGQYHADIVFEKMGIQVKNTTKEVTDWVEFNSGSIDTIIDRLKKNGSLSLRLGNIIKDIYATYYFNIPYLYNGEKQQLINTYNEDYEYTDELLSDYVAIADQLLTYLYDYFMYIGIGNASINQKGNVLFIVNGDTAILASEILGEIMDQVEQLSQDLTKFQIQRPERGSSNIENIVTFTNNNNLYKFKGDRGFISNKASRVVATVHSQISKSIVLTSSYDFTGLITKYSN